MDWESLKLRCRSSKVSANQWEAPEQRLSGGEVLHCVEMASWALAVEASPEDNYLSLNDAVVGPEGAATGGCY